MGRRIRKSAETHIKADAQRYHDQFKSDLWKKDHFEQKPEHGWSEAVVRWIAESQHKRSLETDKLHLRWLDPFLRHVGLSEISRDLLEHIAKKKERLFPRPV